MTARYLLDTNVLSDLVRHPDGVVQEHIRSVGAECIATNIIIAGELRYGARKSSSVKLRKRVDALLDAIPVLPISDGVDQRYGELRLRLEKQGKPIGPNDLWIAAHALAENLILVSANVREFQRVPSLIVRNWLQP